LSLEWDGVKKEIEIENMGVGHLLGEVGEYNKTK
jgi:hypothetical protein